MYQSKVSVIIPVFNEEKYIIKTLRAIISQSYKNYEIIIVNNNSTDNSESIIDYFIKKTPTSISISYYIEKRQGTNFVRELGRKKATGDIIVLLDADCLPDYYWLENGVKTLQHGNTVAVSGAYYYYDANIMIKVLSIITQLTLFKAINSLVQWRDKGAILIGGNIFVSAYLLHGIGGFNTNLTFYGDDIDLAIKLSKFGNVKFSSIISIKTSARRFKKLGFWKVNKQYQRIFKKMLFDDGISSSQSLELIHPR